VRTYPITREQAKNFHNGMWHIKKSLDRLEDILKPEAIEDLKQGVKMVDNIRSYLYSIIDAEDEKAWEEAKKYAESVGIKNTVWSYYEQTDFNSPHGFPVGTAIECIDTFSTTSIKGTTWGELWQELDVMVSENAKEFGNHIFIERFKYVEKQNRVIVSFGS